MRQYLATLHKRSRQHKKRFAFFASGGATLLIFAIWAVVNFGSLSTNSGQAASVNKIANEPNPFGSLMRGLESGFDSLRDSLESIDLKSGYEAMKNNSLNIYGK